MDNLTHITTSIFLQVCQWNKYDPYQQHSCTWKPSFTGLKIRYLLKRMTYQMTVIMVMKGYEYRSCSYMLQAIVRFGLFYVWFLYLVLSIRYPMPLSWKHLKFLKSLECVVPYSIIMTFLAHFSNLQSVFQLYVLSVKFENFMPSHLSYIIPTLSIFSLNYLATHCLFSYFCAACLISWSMILCQYFQMQTHKKLEPNRW